MPAPTLSPGLLVSAARSGAGKTVVTAGLQRAFARAGVAVAGAKCGPDYIDPAFHAAATGRPSVNLDGFAFDADALAGLATGAARRAALVIGEGAMGLYDGLSLPDRSGSTASVARALGWPVLLVLDAAGSAQSVAAVAHGLAHLPGAPRIAGAIVNRVASPRHRRMVEAGFAATDVPLLGMIPSDERMALPSRHLGLVQAGETTALDERLDAIAAVVAESCDLDAIRAAAGPTADAARPVATGRPPGQRIALAQDAAFTFLYPHLVEGWRRAGAEILPFSPLADEPPPASCDACWLPGGYPELHAPRLAAGTRFLAGLRRFADRAPVHGECGGYMVLGRTLVDGEGVCHAMAGLLPADFSFARRKLHLGYRRVRWRRPMPFAPQGGEARGHEYHHCTMVPLDSPDLADVADGEGNPLPPAGHGMGRVTGSFFHVIA